METAGLLVLGFVLGSVPFGVMVARAKGIDILSSGSGNPGATNVWRMLGPKAGGLVFLLDTLKGALPAAMAGYLIKDQGVIALFAGISAVLGHMFSPFLKFKGGKGVATGFGALLGSNPLVAAICIGVFGFFVAVTRYVSLASILACVILVACGFVLQTPMPVKVFYCVMAAIIVFKHRENIGRLIRGEERRFEFKKKPVEQATP